jgi:hypothetical protein
MPLALVLSVTVPLDENGAVVGVGVGDDGDVVVPCCRTSTPQSEAERRSHL